MNISEIYSKYKIMPSLQLHMFRVAGVASVICDTIKVTVDRHSVVSACLLHDMGNIIKFKLDLFPEFLKPEGMEYWQKVQNEYFEKYGQDEHHATIAIAKEIGVSSKIMELLNSVGFSQADKNFESDDFDKKIAAYSDMRVEPLGVVSLEARLDDGHKRFKIHRPGFDNEKMFSEMAKYLGKIEKQIFEQSSINSEEITDEKVETYIEGLKNYNLFK